MSRRELELVAKGKDEASSELGNVGSAVSRLGSIAGSIATGGLAIAASAILAVGAAGVTATAKIAELTVASAQMQGTSRTFERLTEDMGGSVYALEQLAQATRGMVSDNDLMAASNKFVAMGLAGSVEEAAKMAEMATQLGLAMGEEAGPSMENFALMMANQSIPRLDSFAISSGEAREKILALMEANEGMTREQAFTAVVMELGAEAMKKVGEQGDNSAAAMARWAASQDNLKKSIGDAFLPVLNAVMPVLQGLIEEYGPMIVGVLSEWGAWLGDVLPGFMEDFRELLGILGIALSQLGQALGINTGELDSMAIFTGIVTTAVNVLKAGLQLLTIGVYASTQAVEWFKDRFEDARNAIDRVKNAIQSVRDWVNRLKDSFNNLRIPDWLRPGSPAPLELALRGIGNAFAALPSMPITVGAAGGGGGMGSLAPVYISNHFGQGSVRSDADILAIADAIADSMARRGVKPAY